MTKKRSNRRNFIKNSALAILGTQVIGQKAYGMTTNPKEDNEEIKIRRYKRLGRTEFNISDISSGAPTNDTVLRALLKSGVNYIDAGEVYENGNTERRIGEVVKDFDRKKIFIASKLLEENSFFKSKEDVIDRTRKVLERLQTDYVDCMKIHSVESAKYLDDKAFHEGMEVMKAEGRVRYTGISCHGSAWYLQPEDSLEKVLMTAIEDGRFDMFLMAYNFVNAPVVDKILTACEEKDIGTVIMKSNPVMLYHQLDTMIKGMEERDQDPGEAYRAWRDRYKVHRETAKEYFLKYDKTTDEELIEAGLKFVISNPKAHSVVLPFKTIDEIEKYIGYSGTSLESEQAGILDNYLKYYGFMNCRIGCNECEKACPHNIPVNTIMRYNYYFQNKKQEKEAMQLYAKSRNNRADLCKTCAGHCEEACPYGVNARRLLTSAHENLSLDLDSYA